MKKFFVSLIIVLAVCLLILPFAFTPSSAAGTINVSSARDLKDALMIKGDININIGADIHYTISENFEWAAYDDEYSTYIFAEVAQGKKTVNMNGHSIVITDDLIDTAKYTEGEHYNTETGATEKKYSYAAGKFAERATLFRIQTGSNLVINGKKSSIKLTSKIPQKSKMLDAHVMTQRDIFLVKGGELSLIQGSYTAGESTEIYVKNSRVIEKKVDSNDYDVMRMLNNGYGEYCVNGTVMTVKSGDVRIYGSTFNAYGFKRSGQKYQTPGDEFRLDSNLCLKAEAGTVTIYDLTANSFAGADFANIKKSASVTLKSCSFTRNPIKNYYLVPDSEANNNLTISKMLSMKYFPGTPMYTNAVIPSGAKLEVLGNGFEVMHDGSGIGGSLTWEDGTKVSKTIRIGDVLNANFVFSGSYFEAAEFEDAGDKITKYAALYVKNKAGTYDLAEDFKAFGADTFDVLTLFTKISAGKDYLLRVKAEETFDAVKTHSVTFFSENDLFFTVSKDSFIDEIALSGNPGIGDTVGPETYKCIGGKATVEAVWNDNGSHKRGENLQIKSGSYKAMLIVTAKDGYVFKEDAKVTINGKETAIDSVTENAKVITVSTDVIYAGCDHTKSDEFMSYDRNGHYSVCSVCGEKGAAEAHTFDAGTESEGITTYTCTVCGYEKYEKEGRELISEVVLDMPALITGEKLGIAKLSSDLSSKAQIVSYKWMKGNDAESAVPVSVGTNLESGWYILEVTVSCGSDCVFSDNAQLFHKNGDRLDSSVQDNTLKGTVRVYCFDKADGVVEIPELTPEKCIGDIVSGIKVSRGGDSRINVNYYISVDGKQYYIKRTFDNKWSLGFDGNIDQVLATKILPGTKYEIEVEFSRGSYYVDPAEISVTSDAGMLGCILSCSDAWANVKATVMSDSGEISLVDIGGIVKPVAGKMPDGSCTVSESSHARVISSSWDTANAFECKTGYLLTIVLKPEDGYVFAPNAKVLVGGEQAMTEADGSNLKITYISGVIDHAFGEYEKTFGGGCTGAGTVKHTCEACGYEEHISVPANGHNFVNVSMKRPTCVEEGCRSHKVCTICGKLFDSNNKEITESEALLAIDSENHIGGSISCDENGHFTLCKCGKHLNTKDHTFGDYEIIKAATLTDTGIRQKSCTVCGYILEEEIPVLEPTHEHVFTMKYDDDFHWNQCDCGEITAKEYHTLNEEGFCTVCSYRKATSAETPAPGTETQKPLETPTQKPYEQATEEPSKENTKASAGLTFAVILSIFGVIAAITIVVVIIMRKKG